MIDKILYEQHLGLQWQQESFEPLHQNQFQSLQSAIDTTKSTDPNGQLTEIDFFIL